MASNILSDFFKKYPATLSTSTPGLAGISTFSSQLITDIPPTFGDGNLGRLAINATANQLLCNGAWPRYIGASLFIDIDTPVEIINAVADGMQAAAVQAEMNWTTVTTRFSTDGPKHGIAISTFGIGQQRDGFHTGIQCLTPGDKIIITGAVGALGTTLKAVAHGYTPLVIDDGEALNDAVNALLQAVSQPRAMIMLDNGFDQALHSLERLAKVDVDRAQVPVNEAVATTCSLIGLDPLSQKSPGVMMVVVDQAHTDAALSALRRSAHTGAATIIGSIA